MATHVEGRVVSSTGSDRTSGRDIDTIREVDEFSGEPAPSQDSGSSAGPDTSVVLIPRAKSSLAKKLAKSLGFHSHKDSTLDATANNRAASEQDDKQSPDRGVHFNSQTTSDRPASVTKSVVTVTASTGASADSSTPDKQAVSGTGGNGKYVSPFQTAQHQPSGTLTEASAFYSPNSSFNSVASGRVPKAMSASLDDDGSQMRKSRMAPGNPLSYSGDLEQLKPKLSMPDQPAGDERTASGVLSAKSRRSSAYSLKSMDGKLTLSPCWSMPQPLSSSPANLCKRLTPSLMPAVQVTIILMLAKKKDLHLACYTCLAVLLVCTQPANVPILSALHDAWQAKAR